MDFGDIIYVILAIVFSAAGALGKRKKKTVEKKKSSRLQDVFNEMFEEETTEDPIQEIANYTENTEQELAYYTEDDIVEPEAVYEPEPMTLMQEYESLKDRSKASDLEEVSPLYAEAKKHAPKRHHILEHLKEREELKKALIYSEVLKPKFKSL